MADPNALDRRRFFERLRPRVSRPVGPDASPGEQIDRLPSHDPALVRTLVVDWRADVAASWEDGALVVFTQAGAMLRWELSASESAFLRPLDGQISIGSLHDAVALDDDTLDVFAARIELLTRLLDAGVLRVVRAEPAPAGRG